MFQASPFPIQQSPSLFAARHRRTKYTGSCILATTDKLNNVWYSSSLTPHQHSTITTQRIPAPFAIAIFHHVNHQHSNQVPTQESPLPHTSHLIPTVFTHNLPRTSTTSATQPTQNTATPDSTPTALPPLLVVHTRPPHHLPAPPPDPFIQHSPLSASLQRDESHDASFRTNIDHILGIASAAPASDNTIDETLSIVAFGGC